MSEFKDSKFKEELPEVDKDKIERYFNYKGNWYDRNAVTIMQVILGIELILLGIVIGKVIL